MEIFQDGRALQANEGSATDRQNLQVGQFTTASSMTTQYILYAYIGTVSGACVPNFSP